MEPERTEVICGIVIEEFYYRGEFMVYANGSRTTMTFEQAVAWAGARREGVKV